MTRPSAPRYALTLAALAAALCGTSCMFRRSTDPTRFYVLTATAPDPASAPGSLAIGLGPVAMPGYLAHPMVATRIDGTQVRYAAYDRWAEPLPTLFSRALGQDLSALLDAARIVPYPWYPTTPVDVVVRVDVNSFEADGHGRAQLDACWSVQEPRGKTVRQQACSSISEMADQHGTQAEVSALGRAVGELARQMAAAIRS